jgi:hypothetical protein
MKTLLPLFGFLSAFLLGWFPNSSSTSFEKAKQSARLHHRSTEVRGSAIAHHETKKVERLKSYEDQLQYVIALASSIPISEIKDWHENSYLDALDGDLEHLFWSIT